MHHKVQVWIAKGLATEQKQILIFNLISERGGGWHPVTGSVEPGEEIFTGAIRECVEETGLDLTVLKAQWFDLGYSFEYESQRSWQKGRVKEHCYGLLIPVSCANPVAPHLDPKEHTDARWVSIDEALSLLKFPNQKNALQLFVKKL